MMEQLMRRETHAESRPTVKRRCSSARCRRCELIRDTLWRISTRKPISRRCDQPMLWMGGASARPKGASYEVIVGQPAFGPCPRGHTHIVIDSADPLSSRRGARPRVARTTDRLSPTRMAASTADAPCDEGAPHVRRGPPVTRHAAVLSVTPPAHDWAPCGLHLRRGSRWPHRSAKRGWAWRIGRWRLWRVVNKARSSTCGASR
jgi:hypothetical protein